jgi:cytochrome c biogenesis protein
VALLIGIAMGGLLGFQGTVLVKEGDGFANTVLAYDDIKPGRRFDPQRLVPFNFVLDDFRATYADDGKALTFNADLRYAEDPEDTTLEPYDLRVNHPLEVDGAKTYLLGHGYAPKVLVVDREGNELTQTVACLPQGVTFLSTCTIKVPDAAGEQLAFEGVFTPTTVQDPETGRVTSVYPARRTPRSPCSATAATSASTPGAPRRCTTWRTGPGSSRSVTARRSAHPGRDLGAGGRRQPDLRRDDRVGDVPGHPGPGQARRPGRLDGHGAGPVPVAVRAPPAGVGARPPGRRRDDAGRTVVEVAGLARSGPEAFTEEFDGLAARLRADAPPPAPPVHVMTSEDRA